MIGNRGTPSSAMTNSAACRRDRNGADGELTSNPPSTARALTQTTNRCAMSDPFPSLEVRFKVEIVDLFLRIHLRASMQDHV
jgi:hypothetical protein